MNRILCLSTLLLLSLLGACTTQSTDPPVVTPVDTVTKKVVVSVESVVGTTPFALNTDFTSPSGVLYKVTKFRYFVSQLSLIDSTGAMVPVELIASSGVKTYYNLVLVDYEFPNTLSFSIMARPGKYTGMVVSVGVPLFNTNGDSVNHTDASVNKYPLNVGTDMYWGWNPGYLHLKIEGEAQVAGTAESFVYHVGDDKRFATIRLNRPITISATEGLQQTLLVDVNRLFVTPNGVNSPNLGTSSERVAHGGAIADTIAANVSGSGFINLKP